jgi:hypothetical protein
VLKEIESVMNFIVLRPFQWVVFGLFIFSLSMLFFDHFYISRIISDTSAHYIYGELVYEKGEFFPTDFYYANDLFFLRPHFMIALFRMLGMRGFENYALSCSALLATGVTLIAYTSLRLLDLSFRQASIVAILTFLPLGYSEYEFILAQQSHCQQIILTLLAALFLYAACREKRLSFVIPAGLGLSLLAWDSPLRALLLLAAITLALGIEKINRPFLIRTVLILSSCFLIGSVINQSIKVDIHGVHSKLVLAKTSDIGSHVQTLTQSFLTEFLGTEDFAEMPLDVFSTAALTAKFIMGGLFLLALIDAALKSALSIHRPVTSLPFDFINRVGVILCLMGTVIALFTYVDADVRHFLPGLVLIKFAIFIRVFGSAQIARPLRFLAAATVMLSLAVVPKILIEDFQKQDQISDRENRDFAEQIRVIADEKNLAKPVTLYGTFGNSVAFEILMPELIQTAPISHANGDMHIFKWLSRPSRYCHSGPVLVMTDSDDHGLAEIIEKHGGHYAGRSFEKTIFIMDGDQLKDCRQK